MGRFSTICAMIAPARKYNSRRAVRSQAQQLNGMPKPLSPERAERLKSLSQAHILPPPTPRMGRGINNRELNSLIETIDHERSSYSRSLRALGRPQLAAALPQAETVTIADCGHMMMVEQPAAVRRGLRGLLARAAAAA